MLRELTMKTVVLERLRVGVQEMIPGKTLRDSLEWAEFTDHVTNGMIIKLQGYVMAEEVENQTKRVNFVCQFPATWWEHFKESYFPKWLLRRFPVKHRPYSDHRYVTFRRLATFPQANIVVHDLGEKIVYRSISEEAR